MDFYGLHVVQQFRPGTTTTRVFAHVLYWSFIKMATGSFLAKCNLKILHELDQRTEDKGCVYTGPAEFWPAKYLTTKPSR